MSSPNREITQLLDAWSDGDGEALDQLIPLVVDDLRQMARAYLARETPGHTLEPTALVNELYLRLAGRRSVHWESRAQFFASMALIMRRILVDHARRRKASRKGGGAVRVPLSEEETRPVPSWRSFVTAPLSTDGVDLLALDEALESLVAVDPRQGRIIELRYFAGLTIEETATALEVSPMTVKREWRTARLWLLRHLSREA